MRARLDWFLLAVGAVVLVAMVIAIVAGPDPGWSVGSRAAARTDDLNQAEQAFLLWLLLHPELTGQN